MEIRTHHPLSTIYLVFTPPVPTIYLGNGPTEKRGGPQVWCDGLFGPVLN